MKHLPRLLAATLLFGCQFQPSVPLEAGPERILVGDDEVEEVELATLWVSYQIRVVLVNGEPSDHAAEEAGVYYRLAMPPGRHVLGVKLDYRSPTQRVQSEVVDLELTLEPGADARLLDLEAGARAERRFTPVVLAGAPQATPDAE